MAARKKVTKKASKAPERGGPIRQKRKTKRAQGADSRVISKSQSNSKSPSGARSEAIAKANRGAASKDGVSAPAANAVKPATAPRKTGGAGRESEPGPGASNKINLQSKDINRRSGKGANPGAGRIESVATAGLAERSAKAPAAVAAATPATGAAVAAAVSQGTAKAAKASAPTKTIDREPSGGEQKTMKNSANKHGFKLNEFVVYPAHGVGQIVAMEEQEVAGFKLELFVINFVKDKMTLRVPTSKVAGVGMRKLSDPDAARRSLEILTGRARIKRTMWSRRAQEYEAKINSGDINAIAEVVRDLYRSEAQPEQSYSERQLYEAALDRMMREIAAVQKLSETEALKVIDTQLKKNQKRGAKGDGAEGDEAGIEEAA
jgi:CarD family transcriptional regulator